MSNLVNLIASGLLPVTLNVDIITQQDVQEALKQRSTVAKQVVEDNTNYVPVSRKTGRRLKTNLEKKSRLSVGVESGYSETKTKCTAGTATTDAETVPVDIDAMNRTYEPKTRRTTVFLVGSYDFLNWLRVYAKIGGAQSYFRAPSKLEGTRGANSDSDFDLAVALGARAQANLPDGFYLALDGSWTKGQHKGMGVKGAKGPEVKVDWSEIAGLLEIGKEFNNGIRVYGGPKYTLYSEDRDLVVVDESGRFSSHLELRERNPWSAVLGVKGKLKGNWDVGAAGEFGEGRTGATVYILKRL
jgi:opacity protein-like surface antigen